MSEQSVSCQPWSHAGAVAHRQIRTSVWSCGAQTSAVSRTHRSLRGPLACNGTCLLGQEVRRELTARLLIGGAHGVGHGGFRGPDGRVGAGRRRSRGAGLRSVFVTAMALPAVGAVYGWIGHLDWR